MFPSLPKISPAMWKSVQQFNPLRLQLAYVEHSQATRFQWDHVTDILCAPDDVDDVPFTDLVKRFHDARHPLIPLHIELTSITRILIPTDEFIE